MIETALTGEALYNIRVHLNGLYEGPLMLRWNELPWDERDELEAQADELNESRRETQ